MKISEWQLWLLWDWRGGPCAIYFWLWDCLEPLMCSLIWGGCGGGGICRSIALVPSAGLVQGQIPSTLLRQEELTMFKYFCAYYFLLLPNRSYKLIAFTESLTGTDARHWSTKKLSSSITCFIRWRVWKRFNFSVQNCEFLVFSVWEVNDRVHDTCNRTFEILKNNLFL